MNPSHLEWAWFQQELVASFQVGEALELNLQFAICNLLHKQGMQFNRVI